MSPGFSDGAGQSDRRGDQGEEQEIRGSTRTPGPLRLGGREFAPGRPLVMAIVNRTPDSFYRPGLTWDESAALERVHAVVAEGADILDVGGVPAKPGPEVTVAEEIRRVVPFIERVRAAYPDLVISADTWRHEPARAMCAAGADLINDTWSAWDPASPRSPPSSARAGVLARRPAGAAHSPAPPGLPRRGGRRPRPGAAARRAGAEGGGRRRQDRRSIPRTTSARTPGSRLRSPRGCPS